jgi:dynein intermediate chain 1
MLYLKEKQKEQDEDIIITLIAKNPQVPKNLVRFDGNKKEFVSIHLVECMIDHLDIESTVLHKDSEEAKKQLELEATSTGFKSNAARAFSF